MGNFCNCIVYNIYCFSKKQSNQTADWAVNGGKVAASQRPKKFCAKRVANCKNLLADRRLGGIAECGGLQAGGLSGRASRGFFRAFRLLDGKPFATGGLHLRNSLGDLVSLPIEEPFPADGDTLKPAMADDDGVPVAGGDPRAELLAGVGLKALFGVDRDAGGGIETQKYRQSLYGAKP